MNTKKNIQNYSSTIRFPDISSYALSNIASFTGYRWKEKSCPPNTFAFHAMLASSEDANQLISC